MLAYKGVFVLRFVIWFSMWDWKYNIPIFVSSFENLFSKMLYSW